MKQHPYVYCCKKHPALNLMQKLKSLKINRFYSNSNV